MTNGEDAGSAYVFERASDKTWRQTTKLVADDGKAGDQFGFSVSIDGPTAIIGALLSDDDNKGANVGSAYVFEQDDDGTWRQTTKLFPEDGQEGDQFGVSVSIDGTTVFIGSHLNDEQAQNAGSAYVFARDNTGVWTQEIKLTANDGQIADLFGTSVSVDGDSALIGAKDEDDKGLNSGSAYLFERDNTGTWTETEKFIASDGKGGDKFGRDVSVAGDHALVGAVFDADNGGNSGSAYIFDLNSEFNDLHPVISVNPITVTLAINSTAPDRLDGVTAFDNVDGDLTAEITSTGTVDTSIPGKYIIRYAVTNSAGD